MVAKNDFAGQARFVEDIFGLTTRRSPRPADDPLRCRFHRCNAANGTPNSVNVKSNLGGQTGQGVKSVP